MSKISCNTSTTSNKQSQAFSGVSRKRSSSFVEEAEKLPKVVLKSPKKSTSKSDDVIGSILMELNKTLWNEDDHEHSVENEDEDQMIEEDAEFAMSEIVLPERADLLKVAVERFLHFFRNTHAFRTKKEALTFKAELLPDLEKFQTYFRAKMEQHSDINLARISRFCSHSIDTLRRAASSTVFFYSYLKTRSDMQPVVDADGKSEDDSFERIEKLITDLSAKDKALLIANFIIWYEPIPPVRTSSKKLISASFIKARANCKESSTLETVIRGLLAFFTGIGILELSSPRSTTDVSKCIWHTVHATLKTLERRKGGRLSMGQESISLHDLVGLMRKSGGVSDLFQLQSWMLSLFLAGSGVRVGSIRQNTKVELPTTNHDDSDGGFVGDDEYGDDSSEEDNDEDAEEDEGTEEGEGGKDGSETQKQTAPKRSPTKQECLNIEFDSLKSSDLRIFRLPRLSSDPPNAVRLRALIRLSSSKTKGFNPFSPEVKGFQYPQVDPDKTTNWTLNAAIALTILSVMTGSTCVEHVFMKEYEPAVGTELEISTDRNKKSGYAKGIVEGVVSRGDPQRIVTSQGVRDSLHTSSLWKSYQADVYLRNTFNSLLSQSTSQIGICAADWQAAVFNCSAVNKTGYTNIDINNLEGFLISKSKNEHEMKAKYDQMTKSEKLVLCETINYSRWKHANTVTSTPESRRLWLLNKPQLDAKVTFQTLATFLKAKHPMFLPFHGYGRCQSKEPYICPVVNCKNASFSSVAASSDHWIHEHSGNESSLRFICVVCDSVVENGSQSLRSFKRHLNNHISHETTLNEVFNWCFVDDPTSSDDV
ncbi:hypothetical protein B9Z55_016288 [Caenorhabditis nigoni]|nr:hypothetical protein B9Z55_016288 [Caenorhabditis nigoni]